MLKMYGRVPACGVVILVLLLVLIGCGGEGSQAILDLVPLQMQLAAEYGGSSIAVELQDESTLRFMIVKDASRISASEYSAERAREVAEFVYKHYDSMGRIDTVKVAFGVRWDGSVADATGSATFAFPKSELACGGR